MVVSPTWPVYVLVFVAACVVNTQSTRVYKNDFVVQMKNGADVSPADVAMRNGFIYKRAITAIEDHHHFIHEDLPQHRRKRSIDHIDLLEQDPAVVRVIQQEGFSRTKRNYKNLKPTNSKVDPNNEFNDELFDKQWYLKNVGQANGKRGLDLNVEDAWRQGFTGKGIVVAIMDDGIDYMHPDIAPNYHSEASYDFSSDDHYPYPRYTEDWFNSHGTRCAGEVSAVANNSVCVVGVAYDSKVAGIRMLDQPYMTDLIEASSMGHKPQVIDIYSASWGPQDDGRTVDGPRELTLKAIANGVNEGRGGLGSIYVWASGDGGAADDCNCDGYASSMWTISINSAINDGRTALYDESCSSTLASTFSNGRNRHPEAGVATTDLYGKCTLQHSGTSAAAPEAAGVFALALEANRNLTWRDMQHLTVLTSKRNQLFDEVHQWRTNGVGLEFNHLFGFGVLDAGSIVREAKQWEAVPERFHCTGASYTEEAEIPSNREGKKLRITLNTDACKDQENNVRYLEHVQGVITLKTSRRGDVNINMTSPAGTTSILLSNRPNDDDAEEGFEQWPFMTTHNWGENPSGEWVLEVEMVGGPEHDGMLSEWTLVLHGTQESPEWLDRYMADLQLNDNRLDVSEEEEEEVEEENEIETPEIGDDVPNAGQEETTELENVDDLEENGQTMEQVDGEGENMEDENEVNNIPESVIMEYYGDYEESEYEDSEMTSDRYLAQSIYKYLEQENSKGRMDAATAENIFNKMVEEQVSKDDMEKQLGKAIQYAMNSKSRKPGNYGYWE